MAAADREIPTTDRVAADAISLTEVLAALSDPIRLQIVSELAACGGERTCGSFALPVTKSTCTHHFRVLREAGVISTRSVGTARLNALRRAELDERFPGLLEAVLAGVLAGRAATPAAAAAAASAVADAG